MEQGEGSLISDFGTRNERQKAYSPLKKTGKELKEEPLILPLSCQSRLKTVF